MNNGIKVVENQGMKYGKFRYHAFIDSVTKKPVVVKECNKDTDRLSMLTESVKEFDDDINSTYIFENM